MITNKDSFVHIEKGVSIYLIEHILLHHYGYYYENYGDPHQDTKHKISHVSNGHFHFLLYGHNKGKKYISDVLNYEVIQGDYLFNGRKYDCFSGQRLLINYKINKIKKQIKNKKLCTH